MEAKILKRLYKEIEDVNNDFFNLRTVITPDPNDDVTRFSFVMLPNDGAMAHLPLIGAFYISENYPASPPIVHLYTKTGRMNVDAYQGYAQSNNKEHSSLCFNILRTPGPNGSSSSTWTPETTLSALFAAMMSAIVSLYVPQDYGADKAEFVSMGALSTVKNNVKVAYEAHKQSLPAVLPRSPLIPASLIMAKQLTFPTEMSAGLQSKETFTAGPITLQVRAVYTVAVDLRELHSTCVFSVILSNSKDDFFGSKPDTILVRNGVTATAARKRKGEKIQWFYHGKPMNDGDMRLHVTVGADQMTMAYYAEDSKRYILGDCPVSRLTTKEIGDVRRVPFWLHIHMHNKSKDKLVKIYTLETEGTGYIYKDAEARARDDAFEERRRVAQENLGDVDKLSAMFDTADLSK